MQTEFYCIVNRAKYHIFMNSSVETWLSTTRVWLCLIDHVSLSLTREHVCRSHELHDEGAHSIRASWTRVGVFVVDYGQPLCTEDHQGEQTPLSSLSIFITLTRFCFSVVPRINTLSGPPNDSLSTTGLTRPRYAPPTSVKPRSRVDDEHRRGL